MVCGEGIKSRIEILQQLLEHGANPNQIVYNSEGKPIRTVLGEYLAANDQYDLKVIKLLLKYGVEVLIYSHFIISQICL